VPGAAPAPDLAVTWPRGPPASFSPVHRRPTSAPRARGSPPTLDGGDGEGEGEEARQIEKSRVRHVFLRYGLDREKPAHSRKRSLFNVFSFYYILYHYLKRYINIVILRTLIYFSYIKSTYEISCRSFKTFRTDLVFSIR